MKYHLGIIIVNWNQPDLTQKTILSLQKINHTNYFNDIYLIDNCSSDNSFNIFKNKYSAVKNIHLLTTTKNLGFAGGNNLGIKKALSDNCQFLLLLNNDVVVNPKFLDELLKPFLKDNHIGIVAPKIYFAPGFEYHRRRYQKKDIGRVIWSAGGNFDWDNIISQNIGIDEVDIGQYDKYLDNLCFVSACCILIKASIFREVPFLNEAYFMYYEDNEFCYEVLSKKYKICYQPTAVIWHYNSGSSQAGGGSFHDYYLTRNRLIFGFKYAKLRTKFALFRESIKTIFKGTSWQRRGVLDYYLGIREVGSWKK